MANIVGIDLGTSTTLLARFNDSGIVESIVNTDGDMITPSVIQIEPDGQVICGKEAKKWVGLGKDNVFSEFKREMGSQSKWSVNNQTYTPEDLSSLLLKYVVSEYRTQYGDPDTIVISWPANFTDRQKLATQEAARRAGLKVTDYINEPTAAALYYGHSIKKNGIFLVYDMGGGTFDVSLVQVDGFNVKVLFSEGVDRLGGVDMDKAILEIISDKFSQETVSSFDREDCNFTQIDIEEPKHALSSRDITYIRLVSNLHGPQKISISKAEFENAINSVIKKAELACLEMLKTYQIDIKSISEVFMVGGPSRIPALQTSVEKLIGRKPIIREPVSCRCSRSRNLCRNKN
jgi:molecular chaperone DnaK (HSP70)